MFNPSALGIALLVLLATTTMVGSSSGSNQLFQPAYRSLSALLSRHGTDQIMGAYQRQVNTISLSRSSLGERHRLTVTAPANGVLQGTITINDQAPQSLRPGFTSLDLSPYLTQ
ncbi:MAG TPA: hypothetical protein IGR64_13525, partial [Leptolyngbyaceae cyanobacterium M65_K2018_010]|nr:hypothetical protein [Leptolyngbyaceae cyanobacterium M65_K2018_010]